MSNQRGDSLRVWSLLVGALCVSVVGCVDEPAVDPVAAVEAVEPVEPAPASRYAELDEAGAAIVASLQAAAPPRVNRLPPVHWADGTETVLVELEVVPDPDWSALDREMDGLGPRGALPLLKLLFDRYEPRSHDIVHTAPPAKNAESEHAFVCLRAVADACASPIRTISTRAANRPRSPRTRISSAGLPSIPSS